MQFFIYFLALCCVANGASISRTPDSYLPLPLDSEQDINENIIQDEDVGDIDGLLPPKIDAKDYFPKQPDFYRESSYDVDSEGKRLRLKGEQHKEEPLTAEDEQSVREITQAFEKLMKEAMAAAGSTDPLQPVIIMADEGKAVEVAAVDDKAGEVNVRDEQVPETTTVAGGESDTFTTDDTVPSTTADEETGLVSFFKSIWDVVQESVGLAARMLVALGHNEDSSSSTPVPETTPDASTPPPSAMSSVGPIAAFEEVPAHHSLPAHEFDNRRDIDSLLYGRGIA